MGDQTLTKSWTKKVLCSVVSPAHFFLSINKGLIRQIWITVVQCLLFFQPRLLQAEAHFSLLHSDSVILYVSPAMTVVSLLLKPILHVPAALDIFNPGLAAKSWLPILAFSVLLTMVRIFLLTFSFLLPPHPTLPGFLSSNQSYLAKNPSSHNLKPCHTNCGPWTCNIGNTWDISENADSQVQPRLSKSQSKF